MEFAENVLISVARFTRRAKPRFAFSRSDLLCHHLFIDLRNRLMVLFVQIGLITCTGRALTWSR